MLGIHADIVKEREHRGSSFSDFGDMLDVLVSFMLLKADTLKEYETVNILTDCKISVDDTQ